ncbi:MAG: DUF4440 domain-containing protein [Allosphingosinicella sp.]
MKVWMALAALALANAGQAQPLAGRDIAQVQAELEALHAELNRARRARDRIALERVFAPEFRWVHGAGYADDRDRQIANIFEADSDRDLPPLDFSPPTEMMVFDDVVVLRRPDRTVQAGIRLYSVQVFVRRDGRWQILHLQGTPLQPERNYVTLIPAALDALAGRYRNPATGTETVVTRAGDLLQARIPELPIRELRPVGPERFFDRIGTEYVFQRGADGRVTGFTFRLFGGREGRAERVD